jgi:hypothetical protein
LLDDGVLVATFTGDLESQRVGIAPWQQGNALIWVCGHATPPPDAEQLSNGTASDKTTLDAALLPAHCR